ncbi:MAG: Ig-like domain-containing protein [Dokdonella sp.]
MSSQVQRGSGITGATIIDAADWLRRARRLIAGKMMQTMLRAMFGFLFGIAVIHAGAAGAQTPIPLPQPDVPLYLNGFVYAFAKQSDGSLVFGGAFSSVNGVTRSNIARLLPDGTLDINWNPSANNTVLALTVGADDAVYAGGVFSSIGGQTRSSIAKLAGSGVGAADTTWDAAANGTVTALAVDATGSVYAGGEFTIIGGLGRSFIAKLAGNSTGAANATWNASADASVAALAVDASGFVYAGGAFAQIGGVPRGFIAKLSGGGTGAADATWNPSANANVLVLALDAIGHVYVGGTFSSIGGRSRTNLARLSSGGSGAADVNWNPGPDGAVATLMLDTGGAIYAGGAFINVGGQRRLFVARLTSAGTLDLAWDASLNSIVHALVPAGSGGVYAGGEFTRVASNVRLGLATLASNGSATTMVTDAEKPGEAYALIEQPGGGTIVGGNFEKGGQVVRSNILRLDPDGSLDANWNPSAKGYVLAMASGANNEVYVGGYFGAIGTTQRNSLAKLSGSGAGAVDPDWAPSANEIVRALAIDADGAVFAGGRFTSINGQTRNYIAKISGSGSGAVDALWNPSADGIIAALAWDSSGAIYAGGEFTQIGGQARSKIAKLAGSGAGVADPVWNPSADDFISALDVGSDDSVYAGGAFGTIGGQMRHHLAKLTRSGSGIVDPAWDPSPNGVIQALALSGAGALYTGGSFSSVGGQTRSNIAKLSSTGTGTADPNWNPAADNSVLALRIYGNGAVYVGGEFGTVGGLVRSGLAALPPTSSPVVVTTTSITNVSPSTSVVGQSYVVAFTVAATPGMPSGSVIVRDDAGALCGPTTLVGGSGTCSLTSTSAGTLTLTAGYAPDDAGAFYTSSGTAMHTVDRANTTLAITSHVPDPSTPAQVVTVTTALAVSNPGAGTPGGITVSDGIDACTILQGSSTCMFTLTTRGTRTLTAIYAGTADFEGSSASTSHHVNQLPVAASDSYQTNEDTTLAVAVAQGVLANDSDPDSSALTITNAGTFIATGIGGVVHLAASGAFDYTPPANANGSASFTYMLSDGSETSTGTVTVSVVPVNDAPTFALAANPTWPAGTNGVQTASAFAIVTNFGPPDETGQHVQAWVARTIQDANAISANVTIALDGTLNYTLTGNTGSASFGVKLRDDGGTANGGSDTSAEQIFTISVAAGADLWLTIDDGAGFVAGGHATTYVITVHNSGPDDVFGAQVELSLPSNLVSSTWSCAASAGSTCSPSGTSGIHDTVNMTNGGMLTYTLTATSVAIPEHSIVTSVTVIAPASVPDTNTTNNTAVDTDAVGIFRDGFNGNT